jgi:hypothetical protein
VEKCLLEKRNIFHLAKKFHFYATRRSLSHSHQPAVPKQCVAFCNMMHFLLWGFSSCSADPKNRVYRKTLNMPVTCAHCTHPVLQTRYISAKTFACGWLRSSAKLMVMLRVIENAFYFGLYCTTSTAVRSRNLRLMFSAGYGQDLCCHIWSRFYCSLTPHIV